MKVLESDEDLLAASTSSHCRKHNMEERRNSQTDKRGPNTSFYKESVPTIIDPLT